MATHRVIGDDRLFCTFSAIIPLFLHFLPIFLVWKVCTLIISVVTVISKGCEEETHEELSSCVATHNLYLGRQVKV